MPVLIPISPPFPLLSSHNRLLLVSVNDYISCEIQFHSSTFFMQLLRELQNGINVLLGHLLALVASL